MNYELRIMNYSELSASMLRAASGRCVINNKVKEVTTPVQMQ